MVHPKGKPARRTMRAALLSISGLAFVSGLAAPVFAQNVNGGSSALDADNVIVVTAQMREQNLQDIPLSITAVTGDMLEARSQTNLTDISDQAPNVLLQQNPSGSGNSMRAFIRGVGQSDQSPSVEPGVGIYIDDIYFGTVTASAFDLVDLDRVEVLRGPQGTLAGMNSQGGAIKLYSKKPTGEGGFIEASIGSMNRRDIKASADFTVVPDALFARITGVSRNRDGYVKRLDYACVNPNDPDVISGAIPRLAPTGDCKLGELGDQSMYALRGALRYAPTGSPLEINLIGDYTRDKSATQASVLIASAEYSGRQNISIPYQGVAFDNRFVTYGQYRRPDAVINDPYVSYANFYDPGVTYMAADTTGPGGAAGAPNGPFIAPSASQLEGWGVSGTIDYKLGDNLALKSITGYRHYNSLSGSDNDNSPVVFIQDETTFTHKQFSQEVRLTGNLLDNSIHFTIGGIYYDDSTRYLSRIHTPFSGFGPPDKPTFSFLNDDTSDLTSYAGFGNVAWDVTDKLTFEGGIRATHEKKVYTFGRLNPDGRSDYLPLSNPDNPLTGQVGVYKGTIVDYRAVASYKFTRDIMAYFQFATGFKGGGISPRPYSYYQIRPFGPEKLRSYEIGFKTDLFDHLVRLNGAVFHMDYIGYQGIPQVCIGLDGQQLPVDKGGVPGLCGQYLNLANAKVNGFELEGTIRPTEGFTIDGSLSLTDFKFGKPNYNTTSVVEGASRPGIGEWKWSIGGQYKFDVGNLGTLTPRVDVNYTPGYCGNFACDPIATVQSHTLVNARLTFRTLDEDWSVALEATNLFDKFYYMNKFTNTFYATGQPGRPREVALTVRRNF
ncbi:MAG TPA: TonB-dependent receptor [Sphingomonadaceae bacterium]|nr:TonB-dependent receptor [Sphingomonadaceae bacterium]